MNTLQAIKERKSVRTFLDRPVELDKIKTVVEAGHMAAKAGKVYFNLCPTKQYWTRGAKQAGQ